MCLIKRRRRVCVCLSVHFLYSFLFGTYFLFLHHFLITINILFVSSLSINYRALISVQYFKVCPFRKAIHVLTLFYSIYICIYHRMYLYVYLFSCLSFYIPFPQSIHLSIYYIPTFIHHVPTVFYTYLSIHLSIYLSFYM